MAEQVDCVVIGAGVVGLAVAAELAHAGREVLILEAGDAIGTGTSSRNSEVVHAGIYYPEGSLKARFCAPGRERLYEWCRQRGIPHKRLGKLVVATTPGELNALGAIAERARGNGVTDLQFLDAAEARRLEPALSCAGALLSPSTGIVDSHGLLLSLQGEAEDHGAMLAFMSPVTGGSIEAQGILLDIGGDQPMRLQAGLVVNCAGLAAHRIAGSIEGVAPETIPEIRYAKGNYFGVQGRVPFHRLVYPVPEPGGLGVHLTLDLSGQARFGPDVEWIDEIDYRVDPARAEPFYGAIRRYWPALRDGTLFPDYAGIRVKVAALDPADFMIETANPRLVNLYGIESPGLTSSLAIAAHIRELAG